MKYANFFERLMHYADLQGIKNVNELSKALKYRSPEKLYRLERDINAKPSFDIITDITNLFENVNVRWLLTGEGEIMYSTPRTSGEKSALSDSEIPYTPSRKKDVVHPTTPKSVHPTVHPTRNLGLPKVVTVDKIGRDNVVLVPVRARAGYLLGYGDPEYIQELPSYHLPGVTQGTYRMFEVEGQSMVPTLKPSDLVIAEWCESFDHITDGRVYVIVTKNDGIVVKRVLNRISKYGFILAKSDSVTNREMYPNIQIRPEEVIEIWNVKSFLSADLSEPSDIWNRLNDLEAAVESLKGLKPI